MPDPVTPDVSETVDTGASDYGPYPQGQAPSDLATQRTALALAAAQGAGARPDMGITPSPAETAARASAALQMPLENADQNMNLEGMKRDSWGSNVYHGILTALGGKYDTQYVATPNGVQAQQVANTPGQQWKRIISGALVGLGGAEAAGTQGPGGIARGLGGGIQAGYGERVREGEQKEKTANTQFEQERQAKMQQAQTSMLAQQKLNMQWEVTKGQMDASREEMRAANEFEKVISSGGPGTRFVAHAPDVQTAMKIAKADPTVHDDHAGGYLQYNDHIDADGKHNGSDAYWIAPNVLDTKVPIATTVDIPVTKDGKVTTEHHTFDPGTMTYREYFNMKNIVMGQGKEQALTEAAQATTAHEQAGTAEVKPLAESEINLRNAQAEEARSKTTGAATDLNIDDAGEGLATGRYLIGKDIPLRTPKDKADARQYAEAANKYSKEHFGVEYSPELIRQEASFANDKRTQAFLEAVDSMIGNTAMPGQLVKLQDLGKRAGLGGFGYAPGQSLKQWYYRRTGDDDAKAFHEALSDAQSKLGGLIGNPLLGGGESDLKLKTAQDQFGSDLTATNLVSQTKTAIDILENARARVVGRNRFLMQRYGPGNPTRGGGGQGASGGRLLANVPPPTTSQPQVFDPAAWQKGNPGGDVNAAIAEAKRQNMRIAGQ